MLRTLPGPRVPTGPPRSRCRVAASVGRGPRFEAETGPGGRAVGRALRSAAPQKSPPSCGKLGPERPAEPEGWAGSASALGGVAGEADASCLFPEPAPAPGALGALGCSHLSASHVFPPARPSLAGEVRRCPGLGHGGMAFLSPPLPLPQGELARKRSGPSVSRLPAHRGRGEPPPQAPSIPVATRPPSERTRVSHLPGLILIAVLSKSEIPIKLFMVASCLCDQSNYYNYALRIFIINVLTHMSFGTEHSGRRSDDQISWGTRTTDSGDLSRVSLSSGRFGRWPPGMQTASRGEEEGLRPMSQGASGAPSPASLSNPVLAPAAPWRPAGTARSPRSRDGGGAGTRLVSQDAFGRAGDLPVSLI